MSRIRSARVKRTGLVASRALDRREQRGERELDRRLIGTGDTGGVRVKRPLSGRSCRKCGRFAVPTKSHNLVCGTCWVELGRPRGRDLYVLLGFDPPAPLPPERDRSFRLPDPRPGDPW